MEKSIELDAKETQLRNLLVDVAKHVDESSAGSSKDALVLRWAGGWVRDKLLGGASHDIDTAINSMTGEAFALRLQEYCDRPDALQRHRIGPDDIGNLHKIAKNPEKSKHLETTTTKLFGLEVDFVNLRKETYTDDSRNPQMEFGTAEEDALRRDATVNALFYNIHTGLVEDFTGGLADLKAKLIRTPLEPLQTFTDDPLRVLRLIRFASRLQFSIDPATSGAMAETSVLDALRVKISRERVGIEVEKMLRGKYPRDSLELIDEIRLYHTIFTDPSRTDMPRPDVSNWKEAYNCLHALASSTDPESIYNILVGASDDERYFSWVLAALAPWEQLPDEKPAKAGRLPTPLAASAVREGIKAPNKLHDIVTASHRNRGPILALKRLVDGRDESASERDRFGMAIRDWDSQGGCWRLQLLHAILVDVMLRTGRPRAGADAGAAEPAGDAGAHAGAADRETVLREWERFIRHLQGLGVMDAPSVRRIIDGRQLAQALGAKPGKWMAPALDIVMAWQFRNPGVADPAVAVEEVRKRKGDLGIQ